MNEMEDASNALCRLGREVELMLKGALDANVQKDVALTKDIINCDNDVDQMCNDLFRHFITLMMEDPRNITGCMHLHFIAKNIESMGDHVTFIVEQVIFIVTGALPSESPDKADETSFFKA